MELLDRQLLEDINSIINPQFVDYNLLTEEQKFKLIANKLKRILKGRNSNAAIGLMMLSLGFSPGCDELKGVYNPEKEFGKVSIPSEVPSGWNPNLIINEKIPHAVIGEGLNRRTAVSDAMDKMAKLMNIKDKYELEEKGFRVIAYYQGKRTYVLAIIDTRKPSIK